MGELVTYQGLRTSNIPIFTDAYFNTITFSGTDYLLYRNAIDRGYTVMTDIPGSPNSHSILIIGYEGSDLIYMEPADGTQKKIAPSQLVGNYNKVITGKK